MRRGPRWPQSEGRPLAHAAGASVVPKRERPPRPCGGGLGGPKAKEAPAPMRRGPRWSVATAGVLLFEGPQARRCTQKAVHTKGGL